ncbi:MAG: primosomal protein N' [Clostridia bacterium]|nr:primosomal protein N' [Clostridia bacterium]
MALLAAVALDNTSYSFDKLYDYIVPQHLCDTAFEGCRVLVPFGRGNTKRQGVIIKLFEGDSARKKEIAALLDKKNYLSAEMLSLISFIKNRYFCTYFDALKTVLPKGMNYRTDAVYYALKEKEGEASSLPDEEQRVYLYLLKRKTALSEKAILKAFSLNSESKVLQHLLKKGFVIRDNKADRNMSDATQKMLKFLLSEEEYASKRPALSKKQQLVADLLHDAGAASLKEVIYFCGVTKAVPDALVKKGIAVYYDQEVYRTFQESREPLQNEPIVLSKIQQQAYDTLVDCRGDAAQCALLFGVTGSGKTLVYLKLIDKVIGEGKSVIVMVPEISLTAQTLQIFRRRYGDAVAIFHSRLSVSQRMEEWKRVKEGKASIVVGTRSAVFAPTKDLGLIIIDEEQEHTYKSEMSPRYNALEVAKYRCNYHRCLLVLASATPAVEDYAKAQNGTYLLAEIPERYGDAALPEVIMADMRDEKDEAGNQRILSRRLEEELRLNFERGEQSILLLNRRGFYTFISCTACGEVVTCPNCSVSMTYHRANNRLMCHFCGYTLRPDTPCPHCGEPSLSLSGYGTQKIEEELQRAVGRARILRMDTDTTMQKLSHEQMLDAFAKGDYDILIGTQMVAKGLDFANVTLAAVVNADRGLYNYDYRCSENTFSLITQVVGRSGRGDKKGRAIIQTSTPDNPILRLAAKQDYVSFYETEHEMRRLMIYPPFCDLCLVACIAPTEAAAAKASLYCFNTLKELNNITYTDVKMMILGPAPAALLKANNKYRYRLIIKCKNSPRFRQMVAQMLVGAGENKELKAVTVIADVNPVDLM